MNTKNSDPSTGSFYTKVVRLLAALAMVLGMFASNLPVTFAAPPAGFAATASVNRTDAYLNLSSITYSFTVTNTSTADSIHSIRIDDGSATGMTVTGCQAPSGWSATTSDLDGLLMPGVACYFNGGTIAPGESVSGFNIVASTLRPGLSNFRRPRPVDRARIP